MPQALVYVACWQYRFKKFGMRRPVYAHGTLDYAERDRALRDGVNSALRCLDDFAQMPSKTINAKTAVNPTRPLYVVVAPEWMLSRTRDVMAKGTVDELYYNAVDRAAYERTLVEISRARDHADVLLVTGSMLWVEPRSSTALERLQATTAAYESKTAKKHGALPTAASSALERRAALVEQKQQPEYLGYNEALIAYNGGIRKTVLKSANVGDFDEKNITLVPGVGAGTFTLQVGGAPLKVGVCICFDAGRVADYGKSTNLFVLVSQTISTSCVPSPSVRKGGLIAHADGTDGAFVLRSPEGEDLKSEATDDNDGAPVEFAPDGGSNSLLARALVALG